MIPRVKSVCAALAIAACDAPEVQERMGVLQPCDIGEGFDECPDAPAVVEYTDGDESGTGEGASTGVDIEEADDTSPMPDVIEGDPVQGCWGETTPWYQSYSLMLPVESCHYPSSDGAVPWVGTAGKTYLFYNNSAARIGYRNFKVVDCSPGNGNSVVITVQYSQFYSTNDAHCQNGLGDDAAFVDRGGSSAITSLTPLIGD
jgi:hypothetical protein